MDSGVSVKQIILGEDSGPKARAAFQTHCQKMAITPCADGGVTSDLTHSHKMAVTACAGGGVTSDFSQFVV